jgi:rod shape-determining protein MreC
MALIEFRQRSGYLFLAVMLAHILLISTQVNSRSGVPVLEGFAFGVLSEIQRGVSAMVSGVSRIWSGYVVLRRASDENDELRRRLAAAEIQVQEQRAQADRARGLAELLELRKAMPLTTAAAQIIGGAAVPGFRTVTIDKGVRDGLKADMAVVAPAGIVGRIVMPGGRSAKVQLLIDRNAAAGALVERTRAQGVVVGDGENRLQMEYVSEVSDIIVGDVVVSAGIDGIYPKGFVIGRVESIEKSGPAYRRIVIRPAVDFSALEDVLVVLTPAPAREPAAAEGPGGAAAPGSPGRAGG